MPDKIKCPKCGSDQITADKKGFSGKKAVAGALLTGGIGILAGTIGSNKIEVHCFNCGNSWLPKEYSNQVAKYSQDKLFDDKMSLVRLYKAGSIESAKSVYRRIRALPEDAEVTSEKLESYYKEASNENSNALFSLIFILVVVTIVIILIVNSWK